MHRLSFSSKCLEKSCLEFKRKKICGQRVCVYACMSDQNDVFVRCVKIYCAHSHWWNCNSSPFWLATQSKYNRQWGWNNNKKKTKTKTHQKQINRAQFELWVWRVILYAIYSLWKYNNKCQAMVQSVHYHQTFKAHAQKAYTTHTHYTISKILYYNQKRIKGHIFLSLILFFFRFFWKERMGAGSSLNQSSQSFNIPASSANTYITSHMGSPFEYNFLYRSKEQSLSLSLSLAFTTVLPLPLRTVLYRHPVLFYEHINN